MFQHKVVYQVRNTTIDFVYCVAAGFKLTFHVLAVSVVTHTHPIIVYLLQIQSPMLTA